MIIYITERVGIYGENKDIARDIRISVILPSLEKGESIIIDFRGVTGVTQSFIHALLADPIRKYPDTIFDLIMFKNCSESVRIIIETVEEYIQESLSDD